MWGFVLGWLALSVLATVGFWLIGYASVGEPPRLVTQTDRPTVGGYVVYDYFRGVGQGGTPDARAPYARFEVGQVWRSRSSGKTVTVAGKHRGVLWLWCEATSAFNTEDPGFVEQYYELVGAVDVR